MPAGGFVCCHRLLLYMYIPTAGWLVHCIMPLLHELVHNMPSPAGLTLASCLTVRIIDACHWLIGPLLLATPVCISMCQCWLAMMLSLCRPCVYMSIAGWHDNYCMPFPYVLACTIAGWFQPLIHASTGMSWLDYCHRARCML